MMLASFDRPAQLPLVVGAEQPGLEMRERALRSRAQIVSLAKRLGSTRPDSRHVVEVTRRRQHAGAWWTLFVDDKPSDAHIPHGVVRQRVCEVTERDRWHGRMIARGRWIRHCDRW